jgi:ParB-like chromosome segregation protein Spo0J
LIAQLRRGRIIGPFKARPEGDSYGVFVGRRRFLAKKEGGAKYFVVGADCLIEDVSDEEAREASLIENLEILRKEMNPITRAKTLNEVISFSAAGLRGTARRLGISASTLSPRLKVLELSPRNNCMRFPEIHNICLRKCTRILQQFGCACIPQDLMCY